MLDFPTATPGQTYTAAGVTWIWDGAKWLPSGLSPLVVPGINDNRIINGDMRIDQRNNGAQGTAIGYTVDRWSYSASQAGTLVWGRTTAPIPGGFQNCLTLVTATAHTLAASDYFTFLQSIEADMIGDFQWGTPNAQPVTLSFWVQASIAGTFGGVFLGGGPGGRSYPFIYSTSSTWTKVSITIPGDTGGTWALSGNAAGVQIIFGLGVGATYSAPANAWTAGAYFAPTGATSIVSTSGATFNVTGVKLEVGSVATPYNRQSLAKSQADCERYFRWLPYNMQFYAAAAGAFLAQTASFSMRAAPTINPITPDPSLTQFVGNNAAAVFFQITPSGAGMRLQATAAGDCNVLGYRSSASAEL